MEKKQNNITTESNLVPLQGPDSYREGVFSSPLGARGSSTGSTTFEQCDFENPAHLDALANLLNQYMCDPMGDVPPLNKLQQLRLVDGLANHPASFVLFVLSNSKIVGLATCFILFSTFNVKYYLNIHDFFIDPNYRGKGLANSLMQELISISKERKYCKMTLEVREDNRVAQGLYQSLGFEESNPKMLFWTKKI